MRKAIAIRHYADQGNTRDEQNAPIPHVNEEADAYDRILKKEENPNANDLQGPAPPKKDGVSVKDIMDQEPELEKTAPKVMQDELKQDTDNFSSLESASEFAKLPGKSGQPSPRFSDLPMRMDPVINHLVNILMKDGKKATAQRIVQNALQTIKLQSSTQQSPLEMLKTAIANASPLFKIVTSRGKGTKSVEIPIALHEKQRRRRGILYIIDACNKRSEQDIASRLAYEVLNVLNNSSKALERKNMLHRMGMQHRANTR